MKFDTKAYEELYPRPKKVEKVETAVEGFTPTVTENDSDNETTVDTEMEGTNGGDGADSSTSE